MPWNGSAAMPFTLSSVHLYAPKMSGVYALFADKAWYVAEPAAARALSAFLTRGAAEAWAHEHGGEALDYPSARRRAGAGAPEGRVSP